MLCLPFGEFGCPLIPHLLCELFTFLFVLLSFLTNVFKLFEVEVDGVAGKLVLLDRHLRKDLRDLLLLCLGDLLEEFPHAPAFFVCVHWLLPGLTVLFAALFCSHAFFHIPIKLIIFALHIAILPWFFSVAFFWPSITERSPFPAIGFASLFFERSLFFVGHALL